MDWMLPGLAVVPNIHPMLVHFPITLWLGALLVCCLGVLRSNSGLFRVGRWLLHLGTVSGAVALASGYFATAAMDHAAPGHEVVHVHRNFMIAAAVLSLAASCTMFVLRHYRQRWLLVAQVALLAVVSSVAALGADRGALLVYGHGMGVRTEPAPPASEHGHGGEAPHAPEHK